MIRLKNKIWVIQNSNVHPIDYVTNKPALILDGSGSMQDQKVMCRTFQCLIVRGFRPDYTLNIKLESIIGNR